NQQPLGGSHGQGVLGRNVSLDQESGRIGPIRKIAGPAIQASGGRLLVRGMPAKTYEAGMNQRVVVIELETIAQATTAHDSADYQAARKALGDGADRDIRIVEGVS